MKLLIYCALVHTNNDTLRHHCMGWNIMHKIVELNELNIFCEFSTILSQIKYCVIMVMLVSLWNNNSFVTSSSTHVQLSYNNYTVLDQCRRCWAAVK